LSLISVTDNGYGMDRDDLALEVERRATSKLQDDDLSRIFTLGFRGEALPSIGAVARLSIRSRAHGAHQTYEIAVNGGTKAPLKPAAMGEGTRIEVRDLFYATPARLKFMKSERVVIADVLKRLALAKPEVAFSLATGDRTALRFELCPRTARTWAGASWPTSSARSSLPMHCQCEARMAPPRWKASPACRRCTSRTALPNISW
jgi:DNA mismatch repair protein MutL